MKLNRIVRLLSVIAFCSASMPAQNSFTVGTATASAGQKATGTLEVPAGVDAATSIPVVVVRGAKPGPVLALVSGAHGTEYASIIALEKVIQSLDPAQVSGTVIILPLVNIPSFEQKVPHVNPVDGKSMNRFYPGKQDGTQTERVSYAITKQVVERCDYLVDYHGGDLDENLRPYAYWPKSGNAQQDATTRDIGTRDTGTALVVDFARSRRRSEEFRWTSWSAARTGRCRPDSTRWRARRCRASPSSRTTPGGSRSTSPSSSIVARPSRSCARSPST